MTDETIHGIDRRYGVESAKVVDLDSMTREERAAKYARTMKPFQDAKLAVDRGDIVKKYRSHPGSWPDGIDSKYDRWYRAEEWTDEGEYVGPGPCIKLLNPDPGVVSWRTQINTPGEKAKKLAEAKAALSGVETKLGVKPVTIQTQDEQKQTVTEFQPSVTELNGSSRSSEPDVTEKRRGPKPSGEALTDAERAKAYRERQKTPRP